jgi:hypothetical protein
MNACMYVCTYIRVYAYMYCIFPHQSSSLVPEGSDSVIDDENADMPLNKSLSNASVIGSKSVSEASAFGIGISTMDDGQQSSSLSGDNHEPRRPDVSPIAVTDRAVPNVMLGGPKGFSSLVKAATERGLKTCATFLPFVSRARHARKYDDVLCNMVDTDGNKVPHSGSDAQENQW